MPFDAYWFDELRNVSADRLRLTRERGIDGYVPHVGELRRDGHVSIRFLDGTLSFVRLMPSRRYEFHTFFRAYERHMFNFPIGRAFRKQWNIGLSAGSSPDEDFMRIGIGFQLSSHENSHGIEDYLRFRDQVRQHPRDFDQLFQDLGNYYESLDWAHEERSAFESAHGTLSRIIIDDDPPLDGWRFFGRRLRVHDPQDRVLIGSHEQLRSLVIDIYDRIPKAGFGM